jgi:plastocyanin
MIKKNLKVLRYKLVSFFLVAFFVGISVTQFFLQDANKAFVTVDSSGFSPQFIVVKKGAEVVWKIEGENLHWIASDPHPQHTDYPGGNGCLGSILDSCAPLREGDVYRFVFDKEGVWGVHDHLFPGSTMIITVEGDNGQKAKKSKLASEADLARTEFRGVQAEIKNHSQRDPKGAWKRLRQTYASPDGQITENAHSLAHVIGNNLYDKYGFGGIAICDESFIFGCQHGVTERMFSVHGLSGIELIEKECSNIWPVKTSASLFSGCIHGAGHGLVSWRGMDIEKALEDCGKFLPENRSYCYNGIIMEFTQSAPISNFDKDNPWRFCETISAHEKYCAAYMSSLLVKRHNADYAFVAHACMEAPSDGLRDLCFNGLGNYVGQSSGGDFEDARDICRSLSSSTEQDLCIEHTADRIVFLHYTNWESASSNLCELLSDLKKESCFIRLNTTKDKFHRVN